MAVVWPPQAVKTKITVISADATNNDRFMYLTPPEGVSIAPSFLPTLRMMTLYRQAVSDFFPTLIIDDDIKITVLNDQQGQVRFGIEAPDDVEIILRNILKFYE